MKKWLAALFLCLWMTPAALAENNQLYNGLCGLWRWETTSPATVLGDGVYLHVDGRCGLYDATDYDDYHTDMITGLTLREEGIWWLHGDELVISVGEVRHTFPVEVKTAQDWAYIDGVQIGDGAYLPASWERMGIPYEEIIPERIMSTFYEWYGEIVVEGYQELPNVPGGPMVFSLIRTEGERILAAYQLTANGIWDIWCYTRNIPQGDYPDVTLSVSKGGERELPIWYDQREHDYTFPTGPRVGIWTSNGETHEERVEYAWFDGESTWRNHGDFLLVHYGDNPARQVDVFGDELVFYNIGDGYEGYRYLHFDDRLGGEDFYELPRSLAEGRAMGEDEPRMPAYTRPEIMNKQDFLVPQDVELRKGKTWPVYIGPGKSYGRAANGKASVSTNDWVQVFGEYKGWLLVHYAISAEQYRFGWITADALAPGEYAAPLPFVFGDIVSGDKGLPLTDDPLNSRIPLVTLPLSADIEYLAQLGEDFSYVRVETGGRTWWGFVYTWPLGHG